jgi:YidC/Oxa1 family membrane protein insertase
MQEETMKYYKEVGFNPLSACLPLALQLPVFISLVYMLRTDLPPHICSGAISAQRVAEHFCSTPLSHAAERVVANNAGWLFVSNITTKATGITLIVLMVIYVGTQAFSGAMMSVGNSRSQRLMAIGLPFIFVLFVIQFPAGLLIYWIATNITMIPQQMYMLRKYGRPSDVPVTVGDGGRAARGAPSQPTKATKATNTPATATNGSGSPQEAARAVRKPANPPPSARQRQRKKRSGRRR